MVSDGVGGYHGRAELDLLRGRGARGREGVRYVWLVGAGWGGGGWGIGGWVGGHGCAA
jgi:hypothetical protein